MICALASQLSLQYEVQVAACRYYEQGKHLVATSSNFTDWVQTLPPTLQIVCEKAGMEAAVQNISFRRYLLERHGLSLYDYLNEHLSPDALHHWAHNGQVWGTTLDPNQ